MKCAKLATTLLLAIVVAGCGGPTRMEGRYTCTNGDRWRFSPDGFVTYQGRYGGGREKPYVVEGDAVRILRRQERDPVGDNVETEFVRDGDRIVQVRKGERKDSDFCTAGNEQPASIAAAAPAPAPTATWVPRERPGTQVAEVLGLRLGDPIEDVRRKLTRNTDPFREINQTLVSEDPAVFEKLQFLRQPARRAGATDQDSVVAYFSAVPQRLIGLQRQWNDAQNPIPWDKMLAPAVQRYGQPSGTGHNAADTWFIGQNGRPLEPPSKDQANRCPMNFPPSSSDQQGCGRMLRYDRGGYGGAQPVGSFQIALVDPDALKATHDGWARAAENAAQVVARAKLDAASVPEQ